MTSFRISPDDPRLTAYALGELPEDQLLAIEAALVDNPDARAAVAQTRALAAQLCDALAHEPDATARRGTSAPERVPKPAINGVHVMPAYEKSPPNLLRFPQLYYVIGGAAAACFAVMLALRDPKPQSVAAVVEPKTAIAASASVPNAAITPATATAAPDQPEPAVAPPTDQPGVGVTTVASTEPVSLPPAKTESEVASDTSAAASTSASEVAPAIPPAVVNPPPTNLGLLDTLKNGIKPVVVFPQTYAFPGVQPRLPDPALVQRVDIGPTWAVNSRTTDETPEPKRPTAARAQKVRLTASNDRTPAQPTNGVYYYPPDENFVMRAEPAPRDTRPQKSRPNIFWWGQNGSAADNGNPFNFRDRSSAAIAPFGQYDLLARATTGDAVRSTERYAYRPENAFVAAAQVPFSTFSIDVDTASYANVRRFIEAGRLPPADAVRIEELLNYFPYRPTASTNAAAASTSTAASPFTTSLEVAAAPWAPTHRLVRIGLKARDVPIAARGPANLVFLLDVSGSMNAANKLPLVKQSMRLLIDRLRADDHVAIVTYAASSGLALASTAAAKSREILDALESLTSAGSTNGAMGMQLAYDIAKANFVPNGINRVILCTDGDFNVGLTNEGELARLVEEKAKMGVALTVLGFGMGNYQDSTLQLLAQKGNGNYGYIDSRREAEKLLVEQVNGTLVTVAKDVKIQVDFNPARVASYRLIGYENRLLQAQDFNRDAVDAGEVGAGHAITALYEIVPVGVPDDPAAAMPPIDRSRYADVETGKREHVDATSNELLAVKVRYKDPGADVSKKLEFPLVDSGAKFDDASADFKFAAAVAEFGMLRRDSAHRGQATISDVIGWATAATTQATEDPSGYRAAFIDLARRAQTSLQPQSQAPVK